MSPVVRRVALLVVALALPAAAFPGAGVEKTESRSVAGYHGIALGVPALVTLRQVGTEGVVITGDDDIVGRVETVVDDGTLKIRWARNGDDSPVTPLVVIVDVKTLDAIALGGHGTLRAENISASSLSIRVGGSGDVAIERLDARSAAVTVGGNGRVALGGRVDALHATLAGSGEVAAGKVDARKVQATLQGSARATVWAKESLDVTIAGSGEVDYYGRPQLRQTIAGNGRVRSIGEAP